MRKFKRKFEVEKRNFSKGFQFSHLIQNKSACQKRKIIGGVMLFIESIETRKKLFSDSKEPVKYSSVDFSA